MATDTTVKEKPQPIDCKNSLAEGLGSLFNDELTSDITLVVGGKRYALHKNILAASSLYFHKMFYGGQWNEASSREVSLHDSPACEDVFDIFIQSFYTGSINFSPQYAPELLTLADKYDAKVKRDCVKFMISTINKGNIDKALAWIPICHQLKAEEILERCFVIICYNLEKACGMSGWKSLPIQDILTILKRSSIDVGIVVPSEYSVYDAVQNWVLSQTDCHLDTIVKLLSLVEFQQMDSSELVRVEQSELASGTASETVKQHLYEAFRNLAIKADSPRQDSRKAIRSRKAQHLYTKKLQAFQFSIASKSTSIWPGNYTMDSSDNHQLRSSVEKYPWTLHYQELATDMQFIITVHKPRETTSIPPLFNINNIINVSITIVLQNSEGVVTHSSSIYESVRRPTGADNCLPWNMTKFNLNNSGCAFITKGLVAFKIW